MKAAFGRAGHQVNGPDYDAEAGLHANNRYVRPVAYWIANGSLPVRGIR